MAYSFRGFQVVLIIVLVSIPWLPILKADEPTEESAVSREVDYSDFTHSVSVAIEEEPPYVSTVTADVGNIPSGKKGVVKIRLHNPNDFSMPVESVHVSCSCTKITLSGNEIPANGFVDIEVRLASPKKHESPQFIGVIDLKLDRKAMDGRAVSHVKLKLMYRIAQLLCFKDTLVPLSVSATTQANPFAIPFVSTIESPISDLEITLSRGLEGSKGSVVSNDTGLAVLLSIDPSFASANGTYGALTISDAASGLSDSVELIVYKESGVAVSPGILRFRVLDDEHYQASGIIRIRDLPVAAKVEGADSNGSQSVFCEARFGGRAEKVELTTLSDSVRRFKVTIPRSELEELASADSLELNWTIVKGSQRFFVRSKALFPE